MLLHLEIETVPKREFGRRMFEYLMLIIIKHKIYDVAAVVLYAGQKNSNQVDRFEHSFAGTSISYKFNVYKAWEQDESFLIASPNPFALVVLAIQYVLKTKGKFEDRMLFKEKLFELAMQKKMEEHKLARLVIFVDNFVFLPSKWEEIFLSKLGAAPSKKSEMTITRSNRNLAEVMYKRAFGTLPQEMAEKMAAERLADINRLIEESKKREESALQSAEIEKRRAAEEKRKATEEKKARIAAAQKADAILLKSVLAFHALGLQVADIAAQLDMEPKKVEAMLAEGTRASKK